MIRAIIVGTEFGQGAACCQISAQVIVKGNGGGTMRKPHSRHRDQEDANDDEPDNYGGSHRFHGAIILRRSNGGQSHRYGSFSRPLGAAGGLRPMR